MWTAFFSSLLVQLCMFHNRCCTQKPCGKESLRHGHQTTHNKMVQLGPRPDPQGNSKASGTGEQLTLKMKIQNEKYKN